MKDKHFITFVRFTFGSWYSIAGHIVLYFIILFFLRDLLLFTVIASVEAILIGILILMAAYKEAEEKEQREQSRRMRDRKLVKEDVSLTQEVMNDMHKIIEQQHKLQTKLNLLVSETEANSNHKSKTKKATTNSTKKTATPGG